jgi:hypothetical protein
MRRGGADDEGILDSGIDPATSAVGQGTAVFTIDAEVAGTPAGYNSSGLATVSAAVPIPFNIQALLTCGIVVAEAFPASHQFYGSGGLRGGVHRRLSLCVCARRRGVRRNQDRQREGLRTVRRV